MKALIVLLYSILALCLQNSNAQQLVWEHLSGPSGGVVNCLVRFDGQLYAGTNDGVYRSTNEGNDWKEFGLEGRRIAAFLDRDSFLIAGINGSYLDPDSGIFRLSKGSEYWEEVGSPIVKSVSTLAAIGEHIFAANVDNGYRSTNNGQTWTYADFSGMQIAVFGTSLFATHYWESLLEDWPSRSSDLGKTWKKLTLNNQRHTYASSSGSLLAARVIDGYNRDGGIYRSVNGSTWTEFGPKLGEESVYKIAIKDSIIIFAADLSGTNMSRDGGGSWRKLELPKSSHPRCFLLEDSVILIGCELGVLKSTDAGSTWSVLDRGIEAASINSFQAAGNDVYAIANNSDIYRSQDNGTTWGLISGSMPGKIMALSVSPTEIISANGASGILRSSDLGKSWSQVLAKNATLLATGAQYLFARAGDSLYRSSDRGVTWSYLPTNISANQLYSIYSNGSTLFAGRYGGGILRSDNHGVSWLQVVFPGEESPAQFATTTNALFGSNTNFIVRSTDGGYTFSGVPTVYGGVRFNPSISAYQDRLFLCSNDSGVYSIRDTSTAYRKSHGMEGRGVQALLTTPSYVFAGTADDGIYRAAWSNSSVHTGEDGSANLSISPNPSIGQFTVQFEAKSASKASLRILSVDGRVIQENADDDTAIGRRSLVVFTNSLTSGVYLIEIRCGDEQMFQNLIVQ